MVHLNAHSFEEPKRGGGDKPGLKTLIQQVPFEKINNL